MQIQATKRLNASLIGDVSEIATDSLIGARVIETATGGKRGVRVHYSGKTPLRNVQAFVKLMKVKFPNFEPHMQVDQGYIDFLSEGVN